MEIRIASVEEGGEKAELVIKTTDELRVYVKSTRRDDEGGKVILIEDKDGYLTVKVQNIDVEL